MYFDCLIGSVNSYKICISIVRRGEGVRIVHLMHADNYHSSVNTDYTYMYFHLLDNYLHKLITYLNLLLFESSDDEDTHDSCRTEQQNKRVM